MRSASRNGLDERADFDNSGSVTNRDIQDLLDLVASHVRGSIASLPEPATLVLLGSGALVLLKRKQECSLFPVFHHMLVASCGRLCLTEAKSSR